jgi:hypothetical protein
MEIAKTEPNLSRQLVSVGEVTMARHADAHAKPDPTFRIAHVHV